MTFEKRLKKANKGRSKLVKWWKRNDYKVLRVIFFPIWIAMLIEEKLHHKRYMKCVWNERLATKIWDKVLPKMVEIEDNNALYYNLAWGFPVRYLTKKEAMFFNKFRSQVERFLLHDYEIDGFDKSIYGTTIWWEKK